MAAALVDLEREDPAVAARLRHRIALAVEQRSRAYLARHEQGRMVVGAALFDRGRSLCALGPEGLALWRHLAGNPPPLGVEGRHGGAA